MKHFSASQQNVLAVVGPPLALGVLALLYPFLTHAPRMGVWALWLASLAFMTVKTFPLVGLMVAAFFWQRCHWWLAVGCLLACGVACLDWLCAPALGFP